MEALRRKNVQFEILKALEHKSGYATVDDLIQATGLDHSAIMKGIMVLKLNSLVETSEQRRSLFQLTEEGHRYMKDGVPERRLIEAVLSLGGEALVEKVKEASAIPPETTNIALGWVVKKSWGELQKRGKTLSLKAKIHPPQGVDELLLKQLGEKGALSSGELAPNQLEAARELRRRKLIIEKPLTVRTIRLTDAGLEQLQRGIKPEGEVTTLTSELIISGRWRDVKLCKYDVTAKPHPLYPGKKHFYLEFLDEVRRILLSLGFTEAKGPYVEMELWNFDALFQPQDHPAREIHDSYQLKSPSKGKIYDKPLAERIKRTHENGWTTGSLGWRYHWDIEKAKRLILRSQTTSVSVRYLSTHKKPPVKMFCLSKVFRPDVLDSKHAMEFNQLEGIVMDEKLTFRHLLGFLSEISKALELGKVIFRPGYFPFTEPSVESFVKHPQIGWMEFVGAGMFRPEVTQPLGVKYPVAAWGIGIDRLAMACLSIDDIRELHSHRLDYIRRR